MDDLPELPFEKVLSYLSLEERINARAVSRGWRRRFDFRMKILCFSKYPPGLVLGNSSSVSRAFAQNFISSPKPGLFFEAFSPTILSNLKHLRLCDVRLDADNREEFVPALQSLDQLEELDLIDFDLPDDAAIDFELNLPVLTSIQLIDSKGIGMLTVDAPSLWSVKLAKCSASMRLNLVHAESVKRLVIDDMQQTAIPKLKNLEYLYCAYSSGFAPTFLSDLQLLKEIHLSPLKKEANLEDFEISSVRELFDQKQRYGRADLKIHLWGLLLDGPDDAATIPRPHRSRGMTGETFAYLTENRSKLADEIPFFDVLDYTGVELVAAGSEFEVLNRLTSLRAVSIEVVQEIERFLAFLEKFDIKMLVFCYRPSQELLDRLPEHCAIHNLTLCSAPSDFRFLFRLKNLTQLIMVGSMDAESIRRAFEELQFLLFITFEYYNEQVLILKIDNQFIVYLGKEFEVFTSVDDMIQSMFPQE